MSPAIHTFMTPGGEEMVIMSRAEFDRLAALASEAEEMADDIAVYDARKAAFAAQGRMVLPAEVSALILKGKGVLTAIRKWRGLTQVELAKAAGIEQPYLSALENKTRRGTDETLAALAKALDVPVDWITPAA
ncbi:helix-turn-helix domain-containing protein [Phreatobacter aquaticus]|nr:helix-turn-helix transcriptional regulator [Phreatobacter aquaticus]